MWFGVLGFRAESHERILEMSLGTGPVRRKLHFAVVRGGDYILSSWEGIRDITNLQGILETVS